MIGVATMQNESSSAALATRSARTRLEPDPILVYGAPRSGTTYLEQILNAHPEVFISHETRIFSWLHKALLVLPENDQILVSHRDSFVEHLREAFPEVIRDFYAKLAPDARYWGDKNPHYAEPRSRCLEMVAELFPRSLFIHIVRDGRDVVASIVRKQTDGKPWANFEGAHVTWAGMVERGSSFGATLPDDRYFELRYEDLVADEEVLATEVFRFLGLELHADVKAFCEGQRRERTAFKGPTRDLTKGITASEWASVFSPSDQARSLELIGPQLVRHGYETEASLEELRSRVESSLSR
jgi:hypothetical protein